MIELYKYINKVRKTRTPGNEVLLWTFDARTMVRTVCGRLNWDTIIRTDLIRDSARTDLILYRTWYYVVWRRIYFSSRSRMDIDRDGIFIIEQMGRGSGLFFLSRSIGFVWAQTIHNMSRMSIDRNLFNYQYFCEFEREKFDFIFSAGRGVQKVPILKKIWKSFSGPIEMCLDDGKTWKYWKRYRGSHLFDNYLPLMISNYAS